MAGLQLKVTPAGRAAIVNLPNTGTTAVQITQIGVTATAFDPATNPSALPGELKRLTTFAGLTVADDTIHVTLRDESADTYSLRGFALYLADGTLFALYGQAGVILEKSTAAMLLLSADVKFADIAATSIEFGDASFANPPATTDVSGVTRYATNTEGVTGTADNRSITASVLKFVLDSRFGLGAPTTFMKSLLALATAAAVRGALELKSAAMSESTDFAAAIHGHAITAITGLQTALDGKQPAGSYAAETHTHAIGNVTGLQTALDGKQPAGSYAAAAHSHDATHIATGVLDPARVPDLAQSKITGLTAALALLAPKASPQFSGNVGIGGSAAFPLDIYVGSNRIRFRESGGTAVIDSVNTAGAAFTALNFDSLSLMRQGQPIWDGGNFNPATKANLSGAAFTGGISINAGAVSNVVAATAGGINNVIGANDSAGGAVFGTSSNHPVKFFSAGFERGRILANGRLEWDAFVQSRGALAGFVVEARDNASTVWTAYAQNSAYRVHNGTQDVFAVTLSGETQSLGGFRNTSSRRVKDIEGANPYGLAEILRLETVVGRYKEAFSPNGGRRLFLVAENVADHIEGPVGVMEGVEFEGAPVLGLDYDQVIPVLVRAIQELTAEVRALKAGE